MVHPRDTAELISPFNIIFSCVICQKTIGDIYPEGTVDDGPSHHSLDNGGFTRPCKFWLTECTHLTCSEHLPDGGAPFHQAGARPSAVCPFCLEEKKDSRPKKLYGIYGPSPSDHDPKIPSIWFNTPPIKLGELTPEVSALRFQYLSLARYGVMMHKRWNLGMTNLNKISIEKNKLEKDLRKAELECMKLLQENDELKSKQEEYREMQKRHTEIKHYLHSFAALSRENNDIRRQLASLGYEVPPTRIGPPRTSNGQSTVQRPDTQFSAMPKRQTPTTHAIPSSPPNQASQHNGYVNGSTTANSRKRGREDDAHDPYQPLPMYSPPRTKASAELMPPPQIPLQRRLETPKRYANSASLNFVTSQTIHNRRSSPESIFSVPMISNVNPSRQYGEFPPPPQRAVERPQAVQESYDMSSGYHPQASTWLPNGGGMRADNQTPARQNHATPQRYQHWVPDSGRNRERHKQLPSTPVSHSRDFRPSTQMSELGIERQSTFAPYNHTSVPGQNLPRVSYSPNRRSNLGSQFMPLQTPSRQLQQPQGHAIPVKNSYVLPAPALPSLNSLSFIHDPYSSQHRPIYSSHFPQQNNTTQNRYSDDSQHMARPPSQHAYTPFSQDPRGFRPANGLAVEDTSSSAGKFPATSMPTRNALRGYGRQHNPFRPTAEAGVFRTRARSSMGASSAYNTNNMRRRIFR